MPHVVNLIGVGGSAPGASVSASSLYFGFQNVGGSSPAQTLTLSSNGNVPLNISSITASAGFSVTNGCPSVLAAGAQCVLSVAFSPTVSGAQSGALSIADDAANGPQSVALSGNGTDFAAQPSTVTTASITAGQTATYNLQVVPMAGFTGAVSLQCTGAPAKSSCSVTPSNVIVSGNPAAFSVHVTTTASSSGNLAVLRIAVVLFGISLSWGIGRGSKKLGTLRRSLTGVEFALLLLLCSCGGGGGNVQPPPPPPSQGTPPGTYSLSVTATSGTQTRSLPLSLTVK
jgi:Abnormal spindle-like microcephaly-assoc'd, ASPM-SPD-2-Hydin